VGTVDFAGRTVLVASYDDRAPDGQLEHWYEYVFLADGNRLCLITLTTPVDGAARDAIKAIFVQIGPTIETLPAPA
jgi:hypothetical protein